jgi:hypothetical protein
VGLLAFVYYSAQVFFIGAEFTQIYANKYGSQIVPAEEGEPMPEEEPSAVRYPSSTPQKQKGATGDREPQRDRAGGAGPSGRGQEERKPIGERPAVRQARTDEYPEDQETRPRWGGCLRELRRRHSCGDVLETSRQAGVDSTLQDR